MQSAAVGCSMFLLGVPLAVFGVGVTFTGTPKDTACILRVQARANNTDMTCNSELCLLFGVQWVHSKTYSKHGKTKTLQKATPVKHKSVVRGSFPMDMGLSSRESIQICAWH